MIDWNKVAAASGDPEATWNDGAMAMLQEYDRQRREERVKIELAAPVVSIDDGDRAERLSVDDRIAALLRRHPGLHHALLGASPRTRAAIECAMATGATDEEALAAAVKALDTHASNLAAELTRKIDGTAAPTVPR